MRSVLAILALLLVAAALAAPNTCVPVDTISPFCSGMGLTIYPNLSSTQPDCAARAYYAAAAGGAGTTDPVVLANMRMIACALFYPPCFYENTTHLATSYSVWLQVCASRCQWLHNHTTASLPLPCNDTTFWVDQSTGDPCCAYPEVVNLQNFQNGLWYQMGGYGTYPSLCAPPQAGWALPPMPSIQVNCSASATTAPPACASTGALLAPVLALWAISGFFVLSM